VNIIETTSETAPAVRLVPHLGDAMARALAAVLVDCVDGGASVSFMHPLAPERALAFWQSVGAGVARGERLLLVLEDAYGVAGTVQVVLDLPENQPHRADVSKMLVHRRARRRGIGAQLMRAAEAAALAHGRSLLVLDTASDDARRLYERLGWQRCGDIPGFALLPDGQPCSTTYYYRQLAG
jgi:ribosomal protein S18 acetylase RimI-like enzyme